MKSNYIGSKSEYKQEMRRIAKEEIERQKKEFCAGCQEQMEQQTIAVMLYALNKSEGWGKKRLNRLYQSVLAMGQVIHMTGNWYEDTVKWLKDEMGVDLNA